jgi:plasmid stabilization system protein ParE
VKLVFSREAEQDVETIDLWWRQNRRDAPRLFAEELADVCEAILRKPLILKPYRERRGMVIRRWRLKETEQHIYYVVDVENEADHGASSVGRQTRARAALVVCQRQVRVFTSGMVTAVLPLETTTRDTTTQIWKPTVAVHVLRSPSTRIEVELWDRDFSFE